MKTLVAPLAALLVIAAQGLAISGDEVASLEVGAFPDAFTVLDVTGPAKGKSLCYRCRYGERPVVTIFTHEVDEKLAELVKKVDEKVAAKKDENLAAFVVVLTDDPDAVKPKLAEVAEKHDIKNVPLTMFDGIEGPPEYKLSADADTTVMMWNDNEVKLNRTFAAGKLDSAAVEELLAETESLTKK